MATTGFSTSGLDGEMPTGEKLRALQKTLALSAPATLAAASSMTSFGKSILAMASTLGEIKEARKHLETSPMTPGDGSARTSAAASIWPATRRGGYFDDLLLGSSGELEVADRTAAIEATHSKLSDSRLKWDECEQWRVKSLNAVLGSKWGKSAFAMRGRGGKRFSAMPWASHRRIAVGECNSSNIEVGMVNEHWTGDRYRSALKMVNSWGEANHAEFLALIGETNDVYAGVAVGDAAKVVLDDGIDLDEAIDELLGQNPVAGTW